MAEWRADKDDRQREAAVGQTANEAEVTGKTAAEEEDGIEGPVETAEVVPEAAAGAEEAQEQQERRPWAAAPGANPSADLAALLHPAPRR